VAFRPFVNAAIMVTASMGLVLVMLATVDQVVTRLWLEDPPLEVM